MVTILMNYKVIGSLNLPILFFFNFLKNNNWHLFAISYRI
jgi:hypothetical protein